MRQHRVVAIILAVGACCCGGRMRPQPGTPTPAPAAQPPIFTGYSELTWNKSIPELGAKSPEIAILYVDQTTQATQLMIRTPAAIHVRKHWHSANETHTIIRGTATLACDGKRAKLGPGAFNFMPAKMVHGVWRPAGSLTLIAGGRGADILSVEGTSTAPAQATQHSRRA